MAGRGVHFAVSSIEMDQLLAAKNDAELMMIIENIETTWDTDNLAESDKAWNAIHRCLTDGKLLYDNGSYPLNHVICGGRALHKGEDYTICLVLPNQVRDVATSLAVASEIWLKERYFSLIKANEYDGVKGEEDFEYTLGWFQGVRKLYQKAALAGKAVIFSVDA